jgi:hypothetical protein
MRAVKLLLVCGIFAATTLTVAPAQAGHTRVHCSPWPAIVWHPTDNSWTCETSNNHFYKACDYHVDGHRVRGWIHGNFHRPGEYRLTGWAPSQGCTEPEGLAYGGGYIVSIKTCTEQEGCSGWQRVR